MFVAVDDLAGAVGVVRVLVEVAVEVLAAFAVAAEPALAHAFEHHLGGDVVIESALRVPFQAVDIAKPEFFISPRIIIAPSELNVPTAVIGLAGLGVGLAIGHPFAFAVLLDRRHGEAGLVRRGGKRV